MEDKIVVTPRNEYGEPMPPINGVLEREHKMFGRFVVHRRKPAIGGQSAGTQYGCTDAEFGVLVGYGSRPEIAYLSAIRKLEASFKTRSEYAAAINRMIKTRPEAASNA